MHSEHLRIVYVVNGNGLCPELGGSVVRSANVAKRLAAMGHDVTLITTSGGLAACRKVGLEVPSIVLRASLVGTRERGLTSRLWSYVISSIHGILTAASFPEADWVYTDSDYPCDVLPAIAYQRAKGARWVAMVHHLVEAKGSSPSLPSRLKIALQRAMHRRIAKHADLIFTYATEAGDAVADELISLGADPHGIRRVNNGYDGGELSSISPASEHFDACLVGGMRPGKGLYEVVPIWRRVCAHTPARLALVGGMLDSYRSELQAEIDEAALGDQITLLGFRSHAEAIAVVKSSTLMISPSLEEGWGIAVCESLACGTPVVGYDLPAYRSLFAQGMRRVPVGERGAFADEVDRLLKNVTARDALADQAPAAVSAYEWGRVAACDAEFMREALAK